LSQPSQPKATLPLRPSWARGTARLSRGATEIQLGTYIEAHQLDQLAVALGARLERW
jgi:hypothetical protein